MKEVRDCTICDAHLPLGPRPVLQIDTKARILIAGQAPGRKVHETGVPFDDPSGNVCENGWESIVMFFMTQKRLRFYLWDFVIPGAASLEIFLQDESVQKHGVIKF